MGDSPKRVLLAGGPPDLEARMKAAGADTSGIDFRPALGLATDPDTYPAPALTTEVPTLMGKPTPKFPAWFWDRLTKGKAAGSPPDCPRCEAPFTSWKARRQHMRLGKGRDTCA